MTDAASTEPATTPPTKSMDDIMSLCKRRGFVYQASEIYGGVNGFWDYGPMGAQLKKNLRDAWWQDVVMMACDGQTGPDDKAVSIVPVDTCIIQNPKVWEASGHVGGFSDPMVDCRETKSRYRADHIFVFAASKDQTGHLAFAFSDDDSQSSASKKASKYEKAHPEAGEFVIRQLVGNGLEELALGLVVGPHAKEKGTLTEPKEFNLMFKTVLGATGNAEDNTAYLRPETAQGIFINFKNVVDTTRVSVPFGIAQTGKSFRNEVTPRNFTFRSREFEQMEIEFFCHEDDATKWYAFWRDWRMAWWQGIGLGGDNLIMREHDSDELAHYAKDGAGTADIEYRFPFTAPGYGELEGIAHRTDFDLRQHAEHSGLGDKLKYFDTVLQAKLQGEGLPKEEINKRSKYFPHVIEPSAGLDRGVLAILCEAYTEDPDRASGVYMKFHPRMAPIKAAVFPLVRKDGMPEKAAELTKTLRKQFGHLGFIETDEKQSIGKRYARMDEAGCPFCFTIDGQTLEDGTVTCRERDTQTQTRLAMDEVAGFLREKLL
ncbi:MAG: glycyl-tRNA synthetase [Phycisphaerales bacterium]|jgi:glycyl-tRNA synthetase